MADPWLTIIGLGEDGPAGLSEASRAALERAAPVVAAIADAEGLAAHAESVRRRVGRPVGEA